MGQASSRGPTFTVSCAPYRAAHLQSVELGHCCLFYYTTTLKCFTEIAFYYEKDRNPVGGLIVCVCGTVSCAPVGRVLGRHLTKWYIVPLQRALLAI